LQVIEREVALVSNIAAQSMLTFNHSKAFEDNHLQRYKFASGKRARNEAPVQQVQQV
jgi:hypothetical protein